MKWVYHATLVVLLLGTSFPASGTGQALAAELPPMDGRENLALGRPVVFVPSPAYSLTHRGESDATDLTDGKLTGREDQKIWFDSSAVGWSY
ncbi:MAG: hypothetical protein ABIP48_23140, partial [Planctomycetota bacterium]